MGEIHQVSDLGQNGLFVFFLEAFHTLQDNNKYGLEIVAFVIPRSIDVPFLNLKAIMLVRTSLWPYDINKK